MPTKTIVMYVIISVGLIVLAMMNQTLLGIGIAVAYVVTTLYEISDDWSLGLIDAVGTLILGLALGNAMGVTGFVISMGVSIYGGLVMHWFVMKHFPWMSAKHRARRREEKAAIKAARRAT